jgi:hypothetical protein
MKNAQEFFKIYDEYCSSHLMTKAEYDQYCQEQDYNEQHEAEQYAENAWLRHAESQYDYDFERWEQGRVYS